jgi:hypothetical protein
VFLECTCRLLMLGGSGFISICALRFLRECCPRRMRGCGDPLGCHVCTCIGAGRGFPRGVERLGNFLLRLLKRILEVHLDSGLVFWTLLVAVVWLIAVRIGLVVAHACMWLWSSHLE